MSKKRYANTAARRKTIAGVGAANERGRRTPIIPTISDVTTTFATITLDQPVSLKGFPKVTDASTPSITVNAAELIAPNQVKLTFNAAPSADLAWPFEDPAIRNQVGGYVQPGTYPFPE